jgi:ABC-2 type transport system ATP-binding protein
VVGEGTPAELKARVGGHRLDLVVAHDRAFHSAVRALGQRVVHADAAERSLVVSTDGTAAQVRRLLDELDPNRTAISSFTVRGATIDDVFLTLTGHATDRSGRNADHNPKDAVHAH